MYYYIAKFLYIQTAGESSLCTRCQSAIYYCVESTIQPQYIMVYYKMDTFIVLFSNDTFEYTNARDNTCHCVPINREKSFQNDYILCTHEFGYITLCIAYVQCMYNYCVYRIRILYTSPWTRCFVIATVVNQW